MLKKKYSNVFTLLFWAGILGWPSANYVQNLVADDLEFCRQALRCMIFDTSQDIPLAGLRPAKE